MNTSRQGLPACALNQTLRRGFLVVEQQAVFATSGEQVQARMHMLEKAL